MLEINKRQKKILLLAGIIALTFVISIIFIYLPAHRQLKQLKQQFSRLDQEAKQLKRSFGEERSLEDVIISLDKRRNVLDQKFPDKEEVVFRDISTLATSMGIEISSMRSQGKKTLKEMRGAQIAIKDSVIQEMWISIDLTTTYKKLGEFLAVLKEGFPVFIRIESVQMTNTSSDKNSASLKVSISLVTYLISPRKS